MKSSKKDSKSSKKDKKSKQEPEVRKSGKKILENLKVILLGNTNVGKTCVFERIIHGEFNENVNASLAATFAAKKLTVQNPFMSEHEND